MLYCRSNLMFQNVKLLRFCANQKLTIEEDPVFYCEHRGRSSHNSEPIHFKRQESDASVKTCIMRWSLSVLTAPNQNWHVLTVCESERKGHRKNRAILWGRRRRRKGKGNRRVLGVVKVSRTCLEGRDINSQIRRLPVLLLVEELSQVLWITLGKIR